MGKYIFKAEDHVGSWMPLGRNDSGDEVWCDGCCVKDKRLAERIAANMEAAYEKGLEDAARDMIQQAIRIAEAGNGRVSRHCGMGYWPVRKDKHLLHFNI